MSALKKKMATVLVLLLAIAVSGWSLGSVATQAADLPYGPTGGDKGDGTPDPPGGGEGGDAEEVLLNATDDGPNDLDQLERYRQAHPVETGWMAFLAELSLWIRVN